MNSVALEPQARRLASPAQAMWASYFGYDTTTPIHTVLVQQPATQLAPLLEGVFWRGLIRSRCGSDIQLVINRDDNGIYLWIAP